MNAEVPTEEAILLGFADTQKLEWMTISALMHYPEETCRQLHDAGFTADWLQTDRKMFILVMDCLRKNDGFDFSAFCIEGTGVPEFERAGGLSRAAEINGILFESARGISTGNWLNGLPQWIGALKTEFVRRSSKEMLAELSLDPSLLPDVTKRLASLSESAGAKESISKKIEDRRFNSAVLLERPRSLLSIGRITVGTPGNLINIQGPPKQGKTAVIIGINAAVLNGNRVGADTLGFSSENHERHALIHFDTEQSPYDHDQLVRRALKRARLESPPSWFYSYCLTDLTISERLRALELALEQGKKECGGVFMVIIDGVADLCLDPNDSAEAFELVANLHAKAITYDCGICTVIHENPGSEIGKTRGHLGSHIERKAESNLRISKDSDGISTIFSQRNRHGDIPKESGPRFCWSDEKGMHVSCESAQNEKAAAIRENMQNEAEDSFDGHRELTYSKLVERIQSTCGLKERASKTRVQTWEVEGVIRKTQSGGYALK